MKKSQRQVSLRGLRTFAVAARYNNFTTAADELFVTASAVSHQIKSLEEELGVKLFTRGKSSLKLTARGQSLYDEIAPLISQLDEVTTRFRGDSNRQTLRISVQPFFASEVFVPRLSQFTALHPDIDIHVDTSDESAEKHPASTDVSIRLFRTPPSHLAADALFELRVVPACSPALHKKIMGKGTAPKEPFPIVVHAGRVGDWQTWSDATGIEMQQPSNTVHLNSMVAVISAAEQGLGVALVPMPLCEARFAAKSLMPVYQDEAETGDWYYLVYARDTANAAAVAALREWVLAIFAPKG